MGLHSIEKVTRRLFQTIGEDKFITNSSLRRTAANRLIQGGINKEVAQKKTGRVSEAANSANIEASIFEKDMSEAIYKPIDGNAQLTSISTNKHGNQIIEYKSPTSMHQNEIATIATINTQQTSFKPVFSHCNVTINNYYNN